MLEAIFENNHGIFEFDSETRLFTLRDQKSTPKIFLGSVDPNAETGYGTLSEIIKLGIVRYFLSDKIKKGSFVGFVPDFIVGYYSDGFDFPYIKARAGKFKIKLDLGLDNSELIISRNEKYTVNSEHILCLKTTELNMIINENNIYKSNFCRALKSRFKHLITARNEIQSL